MADNTEAEEIPEWTEVVEVLDLTSEGITFPGYSPATTPYDPRRDREKARRWIALLLLTLLAGTILAVFLLLCFDVVDLSGAKELLAVLVSPLVGLVGAATGFYYGGKD